MTLNEDQITSYIGIEERLEGLTNLLIKCQNE